MARNFTAIYLYGPDLTLKHPDLLAQKMEEMIAYFGLNLQDFEVGILGADRYPERSIKYKKYQQVVLKLGFKGVFGLTFALATNNQDIDKTSFSIAFKSTINDCNMMSICFDNRVHTVHLDSFIEHTVLKGSEANFYSYGFVQLLSSSFEAFKYGNLLGIVGGLWDLIREKSIRQTARKWEENVAKVVSGQMLRNIFLKNILSVQHLAIEILPNQTLGELIDEGYGILSSLPSGLFLWSLAEFELKEIKKHIEKSEKILWV